MALSTLTRGTTASVDCEEALYKRRVSFELGATLTSSDEVLLWQADGNYYAWQGNFPKSVVSGSTPASAGGVGSGAWASVGNARSAISFTQEGGGVARTIQSKERDIVSVLDFASASDVAVSANVAISAAVAVSARVYLPRASYRITANLTLPYGTVLVLDGGATFSIDSGVVLTLRGAIEAPLARIFNGAGTVQGLATVYPEWWGALGDGATNDIAALNAMQACLETAGSSYGTAVALFRAAQYCVNTSVKVNANTGRRWEWLGAGGANGTILTALSETWSGSVSAAVLYVATVGDASTLGSFAVTGFRVRATVAGIGPSTGVLVGNSSLGVLSGGFHAGSYLRDVYVEDFAVCWDILHCRLIQLDRCSGWVNTVANGIGLRIRASLEGFFTGDLEVKDCVFPCQDAATGASPLYIAAQASGATVAGVRFINPVLYGGGCSILSTLGGRILDVWFTPGWQYDVVVGYAFLLGAVGAGSLISDVHWDHGYCFGKAGRITAAPLWNMYVLTSGIIDSIWINDNIMASTVGDVVAGNGLTNVFVTGNVLRAPAGGVFASFNASRGLSVKDNQVAIGYGGTLTRMASFTGASDYITCTGNVGAALTSGVADTSTGTNKNIANNWN